MKRFLRPLFGLCVIMGLFSSLRASHDEWANAIATFNSVDADHPAPSDCVLFAGSSSVRLWTSLSQDFANIPVINRGFGGSELSDTVFYFDRLVLPCHPSLIVLYAGENDLQNGQTPAMVLQSFQSFCTRLHTSLPETRLIYISIKPSPCRSKLRDSVLSTNTLIAAQCKADPLCSFVNVYSEMVDSEGSPKKNYFGADMLHMNRAGYQLWTQLLVPFIAQTKAALKLVSGTPADKAGAAHTASAKAVSSLQVH